MDFSYFIKLNSIVPFSRLLEMTEFPTIQAMALWLMLEVFLYSPFIISEFNKHITGQELPRKEMFIDHRIVQSLCCLVSGSNRYGSRWDTK